MSCWSMVPVSVRPLAPKPSKVQGGRYGHCYDGEAGERLSARRAYAELRAAVRAAAVVRIRGRR